MQLHELQHRQQSKLPFKRRQLTSQDDVRWKWKLPGRRTNAHQSQPQPQLWLYLCPLVATATGEQTTKARRLHLYTFFSLLLQQFATWSGMLSRSSVPLGPQLGKSTAQLWPATNFRLRQQPCTTANNNRQPQLTFPNAKLLQRPSAQWVGSPLLTNRTLVPIANVWAVHSGADLVN